MMTQIVLILSWAAILGSGLIAGVFFAFSTFIMPAFSRIAPEAGIAAMQSINSTILRSLFMPVFFGTAVCSLILAGLAIWQWSAPIGPFLLAGGAFYLIGVIIFTIVFNVPLNDALAGVQSDRSDAIAVWNRYVLVWTRWNHVRTFASAIACLMYLFAASLG